MSDSFGTQPLGRDAMGQILRAAAAIPAYQTILRENGIDPSSLATLDDFRKLPLVGKQALFGRFPLAQLAVNGNLDGIAAAYASSGYSGTLSWGVDTPHEQAQLLERMGRLFAWFFQADKRRTLLINSLPAGVRVPCPIALTVDAGPRTLVVHAALRQTAPSFEQIVIIGEHPFLKETVESALEAGIDLKSRPIFLVTGGETMPENFRTYVGGLLGHEAADRSRGFIMTSAGISEIGLSIGQETPFCASLRRAVHGHPHMREALFPQAPFVPTLVQYDPQSYFIEAIPDATGKTILTFTTLDPARRIPLIRYSSGDWGQIFDPQTLQSHFPTELPKTIEWQGPILALWGRGEGVAFGQTTVYPEQVKETIYSIPAFAHVATGNFRMAADTAKSALRVTIQLRPKLSCTPQLATAFAAALESSLGRPVKVAPVPFGDAHFAAENNFQRKFRYLA